VTQRAICLIALTLAPTLACAQSSRGPAPRGNPSELVAAESALAHLAHDKGANAALLAYADDAAEFVAPARTPAKAWVKTHDATPWFAGRQTGYVWASCDGTAGVSTGLWSGGWFATVWKQQKKFNYKWVLTDAGALSTLPAAPDWVTGKLADCPHGPVTMPPLDAGSVEGRSHDGSLAWRTTVKPDGSRTLRVWAWLDGAMQPVLTRDTNPPR